MLIPLDLLVKKYHIATRGVVHVGAHQAEEAEVYRNCGFKQVTWIEGNQELIPDLEKKLAAFANQKVYSALIDCEEKDTVFYLTSDPQSSSIYALKEHAHQYPGVKPHKEIIRRTERLDSFFKTKGLEAADYNFINLDIQGNELNALKSLGEDLRHFEFIYTEVQVTELYAGSHNIHELDRFLFSKGFQRKETDLRYRSWGDALYVRVEKVNALANFLRTLQSRYWVGVWPLKKVLYRVMDQSRYLLKTKILKQNKTS